MFAVLYQSFLNYNKNNNSQFTTTTHSIRSLRVLVPAAASTSFPPPES